jgi:hypothetical protein
LLAGLLHFLMLMGLQQHLQPSTCGRTSHYSAHMHVFVDTVIALGLGGSRQQVLSRVLLLKQHCRSATWDSAGRLPSVDSSVSLGPVDRIAEWAWSGHGVGMGAVAVTYL